MKKYFYAMNRIAGSVFVIVILNIILILSSSASPDQYKINGVQPHKQMNALLCGPGSLEIVFDYWGEDIGQKAIADVARTSTMGTYTWDIARSGHFSYLSAGIGSYFFHDVPEAGFPERDLGYASFNHSSNSPWWPELKELVSSNIPVILLMKFSPTDDTGHYRVITGYDEIQGLVYFMDPWDRDFKKISNSDRTVTWKFDDFINAWNYSEYGAERPYWGAVIMPWKIELNKEYGKPDRSSLILRAKITYPCMEPFDCSVYPATDVNAEIMLPEGLELENGHSQINIGELRAGRSVNVAWKIRINEELNDQWIAVKAEGLISGSVPELKWPGVFYPAYEYGDRIGGEDSTRI